MWTRLSYDKPVESISTEHMVITTEPPPKQITKKRKQPASITKSAVNKKSKRVKKKQKLKTIIVHLGILKWQRYVIKVIP